MTRAAEVAAALEFLRQSAYRNGPHERVPEILRHNVKVDESIALLREPQPEPAAVSGEDEALFDKWNALHDCALPGPLRRAGDCIAIRLRTVMNQRDAALADVARLQEELADEGERADLHADLNRRAAATLGSRTPDGVLDTWHDIPERIAALKSALATAEEAKAKAVEEEREAWNATIQEEAERHRLNDDYQRRDAVLWIARARRNDEQR